jgi:D-sedoheptulose 7-phosphate isomerase
MMYFPDKEYEDAGAYAAEYMRLLAEAVKTVDSAAIAAAGRLVVSAAKADRHIFSCGNGGSAAIANHLVCDCLKGIRSDTALRPKVHSFSSNVELITAISNDIGNDQIFSFQLESMASRGDVLIAISSSGASPNIVSTLTAAKEMGLSTIAMTGFSGGESAKIADVNLHVDCQNYGIVEDIHQSMMHILAQYSRHSNLLSPDKLGTLKF